MSCNFTLPYVWDLYLLLVIYALVLICLPLSIYKFNFEKTVNVETKLQITLIVGFYYFLNFETFFITIANLLCIDWFLFKKKTFLNQNEYDLQIPFTRRALNELSIYISSNYDATINKLKKNKGI